MNLKYSYKLLFNIDKRYNKVAGDESICIPDTVFPGIWTALSGINKTGLDASV